MPSGGVASSVSFLRFPAGWEMFFLHGVAPFPACAWNRMQFIRNGSAGSVYGDGASQQLVPIHGFSDFFRSNRGMQAAWMGVGGVLQVLQLAENGSRQTKLPECS